MGQVLNLDKSVNLHYFNSKFTKVFFVGLYLFKAISNLTNFTIFMHGNYWAS